MEIDTGAAVSIGVGEDIQESVSRTLLWFHCTSRTLQLRNVFRCGLHSQCQLLSFLQNIALAALKSLFAYLLRRIDDSDSTGGSGSVL